VRAERATAQTVLFVAAFEIKDGREVDVEAEQTESAGGEFTEFPCQFGTSGGAHGFGRRHRFADVAKAIHQPAFLIHADEDAPAERISNLRVQQRDLLCRFDVAPEQDHAARLHFAQHLAQTLIQMRPRQADEQHLTGLAPDFILLM
jgi:hypothetical protein